MKEKYNSERHLKTNFESHSFQFDQEAFKKFQKELDKKEKKKRAGWWKSLSLLIAVVFLIALVSAKFLFQNTGGNDQEISSSFAENKELFDTTTDKTYSEKTVLTEKQKDLSKLEEQIVNKNTGVETIEKKSTSDSKNLVTLNSSSQKQFLKRTEEEISSFSQSTLTKNIFGSEPNSSFSKLEENNLVYQPNAKEPFSNDPLNLKIQALESVDILTINGPSLLERLRNPLSLPTDFVIKPYTTPFEKYFYLSLKAGMIINDNFGTNDPYLSILKTKEFTYGAVTGYQFSPDYSIELSLTQHEFSIGYYAKDFTYDTKSGGKATVLKAALVSNIWTPFQGIQFNMTNGLGMFYGKDGSYSKGTSGSSTPEFIEKAMLTRLNINSGWRLMYSGGLQLNFNLSQSLEGSFSSEYMLGFKPLSDSQLTYIEGEGGSGQNRNVAAFSKGNFYSFTFGLKYNLKGE